MLEFVKQIITGQFEAALCMMNDCLRRCPEPHWDGIIGKYPFWQVAYHTLCFVDLYLSPSPEAFVYRDIHPNGRSEFDDEYPSRRFERAEITEYLAVCREKMVATLAAEPERVFTKRELLESVWDFKSPGRTRTLDSHASRLRQKLAEFTDTPYVVNLWGVGYRLHTPQ